MPPKQTKKEYYKETTQEVARRRIANKTLVNMSKLLRFTSVEEYLKLAICTNVLAIAATMPGTPESERLIKAAERVNIQETKG